MPTGVIRRGGSLTGRISTGSGGGPSSYIPLDVEEIEVVDTIIGSMIGEVQQAPPVTINSAGTDTIAMTVYGGDGGVGDYNSTTGKYDIPIVVDRTNLFDYSNPNMVDYYPYNGTGECKKASGANAKYRSFRIPVTAGKTYCVSAVRGTGNTFRVATYSGTTPAAGDACSYWSNGTRTDDNVYIYDVFTAPEGAQSLLVFLISNKTDDEIAALVSSRTLQLQVCESSAHVTYYHDVTTVNVDEPLLAGQYAVLTGSDLPTLCVGSNTITIDTTVQPGEVYIRYFEMR